MINPHQENYTNLSSADRKVCSTCRGAGKQINNQDGTMPQVFGQQTNQGTCPSCNGTGFRQEYNWHRSFMSQS